MNENEISVEESFYRIIATILCCDKHDYTPYPYMKRTRWNNRNPGNGRYHGHGLVRRYSSSSIWVCLHTPHVMGHFASEQQAFLL